MCSYVGGQGSRGWWSSVSAISCQLQRSAVSCKKPNVRVHSTALHCAALQCTAWHCALALNPVTGTQTLDCLRSPALWCILGADLGTLFKHKMCSYVVGQGCECQHQHSHTFDSLGGEQKPVQFCRTFGALTWSYHHLMRVYSTRGSPLAFSHRCKVLS